MAKLKDPASKAKANFLYNESKMGLTFAHIARDTSDGARKKRVTEFARKAYETTGRLRNHVQLNAVEDARLTRNLLRLREALELLGEAF